jgi:hypothetical protein
MKLTVNKDQFVSNILAPVSKVSDNLLLDFSSDKLAKTMATSSDNSVVLFGAVSCEVTNETKCVIPDCKTFLRLFSGISQERISLEINSNAISYKDDSMSFKYHLLDESYIVNKKSISEEKLEQLSYDTSFVITKQKLSEIIKFNSIVPDAEKLYFFTEGTKVHARLGDEQKINVNEITTETSSSFQGVSLTDEFPINIQNILLFAFNSNEITVKVNQQLKVFKFESPLLKYIVSGLVK